MVTLSCLNKDRSYKNSIYSLNKRRLIKPEANSQKDAGSGTGDGRTRKLPVTSLVEDLCIGLLAALT